MFGNRSRTACRRWTSGQGISPGAAVRAWEVPEREALLAGHLVEVVLLRHTRGIRHARGIAGQPEFSRALGQIFRETHLPRHDQRLIIHDLIGESIVTMT